jgi:hypothetical protein
VSVFAALIVIPIVVGFLVGRWWFLLALGVIWLGIAIFLVVNDGWRGAGWGDFGVALNVIAALVTFGGAALGIALRRARGGRFS